MLHGCNYFLRIQEKEEENQKEEWVLKNTVNHFLIEFELTVKETTFKEYTRKLNQVLSLIDGQTPLQELERVNGGKEIIEEAFFDTHPESDDASFEGVWNSYPFFESGVIALSDIKRGLFLIKRK